MKWVKGIIMTHGFLILLHNNYEQARKLMTLLDEENSYIFIHIDKKSILTDEDKSLFLRDVHLAQVIFVERVSVQWGDIVKFKLH